MLGVALMTGAVQESPAPLLDATRAGDVETVRSLLAGGADANAARGDGVTALHLAAERGRLDIAKLLIGAGASAGAETRIGAYTPLHVAAEGGHVDLVEALLGAGANASAKTTNSGVTPLHLAAKAPGGEGAVRALVAAGAPMDAREASSGQTALMFAAAYGRAEAVRELLSRGADAGITTEVVDVLQRIVIDREASQFLRQTITDLQDAAAGDDASRAEPTPEQIRAAILAQRDFLRANPTVEDFDPASLASQTTDYPGGPRFMRPPFWETLVGKTGGMTALLHAAREGHVDAARALLEGGADVDQTSGDGTSPLLMATLNGQLELAMLLIEQGADPNVASTTDGSSPLFAVLQTQWAPKSNYPQPRAQDDQRVEYLDVLRALLEAGADPDRRLNTHLWYWEYGLNKMGMDLTGATPFWRATFAQDIEAMRLLVAFGADPEIPTRWPVVGMRERRQQDGRQQEDSGLPWIPEGAPNAHAIHAAAGGGWMGLGAFSVRSVPDNFLPAVQYLVEELGADVNLTDSWGYAPIHYAAVRGDNELIEYLVSKGAEVAVVSRLGQSPADMARGGRAGFFSRTPYPRTAELLQSLGSPFLCLHTHFLDTGDFCPGAGVNDPYRDEPGRGNPIGFPTTTGSAGGGR
jgi:ankyrin repeat protein